MYQSNCNRNDALICCLFNLIFNSGVLSDSWLEGVIWPIYKNKGDSKSPENYRPITILSCFGKFFTSILNARHNKLLDAHTILEENQAGFRAGYLTMDHVFVLCALTEIARPVGLWKKRIASNINRKCFQMIFLKHVQGN